MLVDSRRVCRWRCVADWLMPEFLPAGRLGPGAPDGGVVGRRWSSCRKNFPAGRWFRQRQRVLELLMTKVGWLEGDTTTRWVARRENTAKP